MSSQYVLRKVLFPLRIAYLVLPASLDTLPLTSVLVPLSTTVPAIVAGGACANAGVSAYRRTACGAHYRRDMREVRDALTEGFSTDLLGSASHRGESRFGILCAGRGGTTVSGGEARSIAAAAS